MKILLLLTATLLLSTILMAQEKEAYMYEHDRATIKEEFKMLTNDVVLVNDFTNTIYFQLSFSGNSWYNYSIPPSSIQSYSLKKFNRLYIKIYSSNIVKEYYLEGGNRYKFVFRYYWDVNKIE